MMCCVRRAALVALLALGGAAYDNGVGRLPVMGWSTWCVNGDTWDSLIPCYNDYCNEKEVKDVAQHMLDNGLHKLGYDTILLDDCWAAKQRGARGEMRADASRFPSGTLAPLASWLKHKGFQLMAYTDVGEKTCRDGRLGSWPHYAQDAKTMVDWGLSGVKMDWCDHPGGHTQQQLYGNFSHALNSTGHPMLFNICGWGHDNVWEWGGKIATSARVGPDHLPVWWLPPNITNQDPGTVGSTQAIIQHMRHKSRYYGPFNHPDLDFLEPGYSWNGATSDRTAFSFWCLFSSPLMVATDVRKMKNKELLMNAEAIAVNQDPLVEIGDIRDEDGPAQVWSRRLSGGRWAVILFNNMLIFGDRAPVVRFTAQHLPGWPAGASAATVRDLWSHTDLGTFDKQFSRSLSARESAFLIVAPTQRR